MQARHNTASKANILMGFKVVNPDISFSFRGSAGIAGMIDIVLVNDTLASPDLERVYQDAGARPVPVDDDRLAQLGVRVVHASLATGSNVFRHDPALLTETLLRFAR